MNLEFATSSRVIFGRGEFKRLGEIAETFGKRALLVTGRSSLGENGNLERLVQLLRQRAIPSEVAIIDREPTVKMIDGWVSKAKEFHPEVVIAIGGGSAMDAGKAIGAMLTNAGSVKDYLEKVGTGKLVENKPVPVIAVPTTAGTGSEVTKNAVIRDDGGTFKRSMRSPMLRPEVALVDPMLTVSMPPAVTAACGFDAQTQLIEGFTSRRAGILTDGLAREGMGLIASALEQAYFNPEELEARESAAMASLLSGMVLDNVGLGAVHGLAAPIGAMFEIPHGVVCANLLPEIVDLNLQAAEKDLASAKTLSKYAEVARIVAGEPGGRIGRLVTTLRLQRRTLNIPNFSTFGMKIEHVPEILAGCRGGSMETNPVYLSDAAMGEMLCELIEKGERRAAEKTA